MDSITDIVSYLEFGRATLLGSIENLSKHELTEAPILDGWTLKDVLAHIIGWDQWVIQILPLIVQDRADEIPDIEVEAHNRQSVAAWHDKSITEVLAEIRSTHQQILDIITSLDHTEIDKRRDRKGRIITIRSYVIDVMIEHERQHALEIEQWREELDQAIDPMAVRAFVRHCREAFMARLDQFDEAYVLDKRAVGIWSISDVVGHIADWEQLALKAARHIQDPSQPAVRLAYDNTEDWNIALVAERAKKSWPENYHYLRQTQIETETLMATIEPEAWKLRGPYPWSSDQGTLAELLMQMAEHYTDHLPDLERWYKEKYREAKN